jgi:bifunctional NMN adenylyltransferase/nudix hydrolase
MDGKCQSQPDTFEEIMNNATSLEYDVAVLIGRFQGFHKGQEAPLNKALESASRVIVVLGSSYRARSAKNPFTWEERAAMIACTLDEATKARVSFVPVRDYYDDKRWSAAVRAIVGSNCNDSERKIALVGFHKDASSYYLGLFPQWSFVESQQYDKIDATTVRQIYFEGDDPAATRALLSGLVHSAVVSYLIGWMRLPQYAQMKKEHLAIEKSKKTWGVGPFITVDAVVTVSNHVLLVRRGGDVGNGLWAVPGGFLDSRERLLQGAIRELKEETGLAALNSSLEESLKGVAVFDHADRGSRGRTITHAHWFDLGESRRLPLVAGADDAAEAKWIPFTDLPGMEEQFFEDHFSCILKHFLPIAEM